MLHTKFHGNRPAGSGEENILKGFYHIRHWWPSWSCDQHHVIRFLFPCIYLKAFIKNWVQISKVVSAEIRFEFFVCTRPWAKVKK